MVLNIVGAENRNLSAFLEEYDLAKPILSPNSFHPYDYGYTFAQ